ncbi:hypothetical protein AAZV13_09G029100 [Glycine max]
MLTLLSFPAMVPFTFACDLSSSSRNLRFLYGGILKNIVIPNIKWGVFELMMRCIFCYLFCLFFFFLII